MYVDFLHSSEQPSLFFDFFDFFFSWVKNIEQRIIVHYITSSTNMQLTSLKGITKNNVIFEAAFTNQHGHQRINIRAKHGLGEYKPGPLVVASPFRFSFGVQPSLSKSGDVTGYTLPTPLWNPQEVGPTRKEFDFYEALKELKHI